MKDKAGKNSSHGCPSCDLIGCRGKNDLLKERKHNLKNADVSSFPTNENQCAKSHRNLPQCANFEDSLFTLSIEGFGKEPGQVALYIL